MALVLNDYGTNLAYDTIGQALILCEVYKHVTMATNASWHRIHSQHGYDFATIILYACAAAVHWQ